MLWLLPDAGVYVTEQVADDPLPLNVHTAPLLIVPVLPLPLLVNVTVPVGVLGAPAEMSETVAVHVVAWARFTAGGKQLTVVLVERLTMLKELLVAAVRPELDA